MAVFRAERVSFSGWGEGALHVMRESRMWRWKLRFTVTLRSFWRSTMGGRLMRSRKGCFCWSAQR
eukprot:12653170-Ditylum_brightwellii.AAC.1